MSKFVGTGPLSYAKRIYRTAVLQRLSNTALNNIYGSFSQNTILEILENSLYTPYEPTNFTFIKYSEEGILQDFGFWAVTNPSPTKTAFLVQIQ
jgi:hypothetical protein